ncbi:MAG: hypothetical protein WBA18_07760 [Terracidiphilus sp.]
MTSKQFDLVGNIFVKKAVHTEANGEEKQGMAELVNRNKQQKAVVALASGAGEESGKWHDDGKPAAYLKGK